METRPSPVLDQREVQELKSSTDFSVCPHFGVCGGCSTQNLAYLNQLSQKEKRVRDILKDLPVQNFHPILPSPEIQFYRNKMEYSFGDQRDLEILSKRNNLPATLPAIHIGLHPKKSFGLVTPTPDCFLLSPEAQKILKIVSGWANRSRNPVYLRKDNSGVLRHLVIREGKNTGERLVNLITTSAVKGIEDLASDFRREDLNITTFIWTSYDGLSDVAQGDHQTVLWGEGTIQEKIGPVSIRVAPRTFMQTNTHAAEKMIGILKDWLGVGDTLLDLYCGTGAIGLNLAGHFIYVNGVESEPASVESAAATARENKIVNFSASQSKVEDLLSIFEENRGRIDACIVDPPRVGLHKDVAATLNASRIPLLAYVSCNPETLARDLKILSADYSIEDVQPLDFFPHTDHVETMVRLRAK